MTVDRRIFTVLAVLLAGALTAGCGGGTDEAKTIGEARAALSKDCQQGKASDKPLCDCLAGELEAQGKSAQQITEIADKVNSGEEPAELAKAAATCGAKLAGGG